MIEEAIGGAIAAWAGAAAELRCGQGDGAQDYLIDQFLLDRTDRRSSRRYSDATLRESSHYAAEVVTATRAAAGPDMSLIPRVSQWKQQA